MKEVMNERLKDLACSQECMVGAADILEQWENSQMAIEKSTFDSINISDKALNLSKEGRKLTIGLQNYLQQVSPSVDQEASNQISSTLNEINLVFHNLVTIAQTSNEISHSLEREVAGQRIIAEDIKNSVEKVMESVSSAVACAEFMMADM